jgi:YD repeat-containing protein
MATWKNAYVVLFALFIVCYADPTPSSAGVLAVQVISISTTCVGQEPVAHIQLRNDNPDYEISDVKGKLQILKGTTVLAEASIGVHDLEPRQIKDIHIDAGWLATETGSFIAKVTANGFDNVNGEQNHQKTFTVCPGDPCPDRPTASGNVIYLGAGSSGSLTYSVSPSSCCFEFKFTIVTGRNIVQSHSPDTWVAIGSGAQVQVAVDRSKLSEGTIVGRVDWRSCDRKKVGADFILVRDGSEQSSGEPTAQPPGTTTTETPATGTDGYPVATSTGEFFLRLSAPDIGVLNNLLFGVTRSYYSNLHDIRDQQHDFGPGWTHNLDWLIVPGYDEVIVFGPGNYVARFIRGDGAWILDWPKRDPLRLIETDTLQFALSIGTLGTWHFGRYGLLDKIRFTNGKSYRLTYEKGFIEAVEGDDGRKLTFTRDSTGKITQISEGSRSVGYGYTNGLLSSFTNLDGKTTKYEYSSGTSLLERTVSPAGRTVFETTYDTDGKVNSQTFGEDQEYTFGYAASTTSITGPSGSVTTHTHDNMNRLTRWNSPSGGSSSYGYDGNGNRVQVTGFYGGAENRMYNNGLLVRTQWPNGAVRTVDYTMLQVDGVSSARVGSVNVEGGPALTFGYNTGTGILNHAQMSSGRRTEFDYNSALRPIEIRDLRGTTSFTYNSLGQIAAATLRDGSTQSHLYAEGGYLKSIARSKGVNETWTTNPLGLTASYTYGNGTWRFTRDDDGNLTEVNDPVGRQVRYQWDDRNRLRQIQYGSSTSLELKIDWKGAYTSQINDISIERDDMGRPTVLTSSAGESIALTHDDEDAVTSITKNGSTWDLSVDNMGRYTAIDPPFGGSYMIEWARNGLPSSYTNPIGVRTTYSVDSSFASGSVSIPLGLTQSYSTSYSSTDQYDYRVNDANGNAWELHYDGSAGTKTFTSPSGRTVQESYDPYGNLLEIDWGSGQTAVYEWTNGRNTKISMGDFELIATYDQSGLLFTMNGEQIDRDEIGRPTSANGTTVTYDVNGNVSSLGIVGMVATQYLYLNGRLQTITDFLDSTTTFTYGDDGLVSQIDFPNDFSMYYEHNPLGDIKKVSTSDGWSMEYTYADDGRLTNISRTDNIDLSAPPSDVAVVYDVDNRIVGADYDAVGNLNFGNKFGLSVTYSYGGLSGINGSDNVELDAFGMIRSIEDGSGRVTTHYSPLTTPPALLGMQIDDVATQTWSYVTTPNGQVLYGVDQMGKICIFIDDGRGNVVAETDGNGTYHANKWFTPYGVPIGSDSEGPQLGFGGVRGNLTIGGFIAQDGGRDIINPDLAVQSDARVSQVGFPETPTPQDENGQTTTNKESLDPILEGLNQYFLDKSEAPVIQAPQPKEDKQTETPRTQTPPTKFDPNSMSRVGQAYEGLTEADRAELRGIVNAPPRKGLVERHENSKGPYEQPPNADDVYFNYRDSHLLDFLLPNSELPPEYDRNAIEKARIQQRVYTHGEGRFLTAEEAAQTWHYFQYFNDSITDALRDALFPGTAPPNPNRSGSSGSVDAPKPSTKTSNSK